MTQTAPPTNLPIDFSRVEALRAHMKLHRNDMARLFGVTRMTYYRWVKGYPLRGSHQLLVRERVKQLAVVVAGGWPTQATMNLSSAERCDELLRRLN